MLKRPNW